MSSETYDKEDLREVIEEYQRSTNLKRKNIDSLETNLKKAMSEVGFNLKYVKDNPQATQIADLQF